MYEFHEGIYIKALLPWVDDWLLLTQKNKDGGDSLYRTSLYAILLWFAGYKEQAKLTTNHIIACCETYPGIYRRHPDKREWYSNPWATSRDQYAKLMLALILTRQFSALFRLLFRQVLMLGFYTNFHKGTDCEGWRCFKIPDWFGLGDMAVLYRTFFPLTIVGFAYITNWHWLESIAYSYVIMSVFDIKYLADLWFRKLQPWDYDSLMAVELMFASFWLPTPVSFVAGMIYKRSDYGDRILHNYANTDNDIQPLGDFYVAVARTIFKKYLF